MDPLDESRGRSMLYMVYSAAERFAQSPEWFKRLSWADQIRVIAYDQMRTQEEHLKEIRMIEAQIPQKALRKKPHVPRRFSRGSRRGRH